MKHALKPSQYAILITIMLTASVGDTLLSRGMAQVGQVDLHHLGLLWKALFNPFVISGIVLLIGFFASYMTASSPGPTSPLSCLPPPSATVVVALLSRFWLHEHLSLYRWAGILLIIVCAVGFVAGGPSRTENPEEPHELGLMDSGAGR